jgi:replicative DNA helicase
MLSEALGICFDSHVGHDYIEDAESRFEFYHRVEEKVALDLDMFNKITKGGFSNKSLNVILAGTAVGKSLFMCHVAASTLMQGKNVLYITMEMAEERIAERIDANLLNVTIDDLRTIDKAIFDTRINKLSKKTQGKLIIKEYPTTSAHSGHFRALIEELRIKRDFVPDIIMIDYLNICASARMKLGASVNSYTYIKSIAEELRGLAVEHNLPILTATQTTRCLATDTLVDVQGKGIIALVDVVVGDKILSNTGRNTITNKFPVEDQVTYTIKTNSGKTIICSEKHIFPTDKGEVSINSGLQVGDSFSSQDI